MGQNLKLFRNIIIIALFFGLISACGIYKYSDAKKNPTNANERIKKNLEEGKGFRIGDLNKPKGDFQFASSNPLWRAGMEILSFAPLNNVDYSGGVIVTDWFSEDGLNEEIKITIRYLSNEIRADGVDVIIHKKICNKNSICKINAVESNLNAEIKLAILKKATLIEKQDLKKKAKERGPIKIPGKKNQPQ